MTCSDTPQIVDKLAQDLNINRTHLSGAVVLGRCG